MALVCDGNGQIAVSDIMTAVNQNETDIAIINGGGNSVDGRVTQNEENIVLLDARVLAIETDGASSTDLVALTSRVSANEVDIADNVIDIAANTASIVTNINSIGLNTSGVATNLTSIDDHEIRVDTLETANTVLGGRVGVNETNIGQNASDISALQAASGAGNEAIYVHEELTSVDGGSSTTSTWTARNVATMKLNDVGATGGATSITLPLGVYDLEAHAIVKGSAHQTRINIGGSTYIYGISSHVEGMSTVIGRIDIAAPTVVSIETNVDLGVATNGFGLSNTFGTTNTYVTFHIEKVG